MTKYKLINSNHDGVDVCFGWFCTIFTADINNESHEHGVSLTFTDSNRHFRLNK